MSLARYPGIENEQITAKHIIKLIRKNTTYASIIQLWLLHIPKYIQKVLTTIESLDQNAKLTESFSPFDPLVIQY